MITPVDTYMRATLKEKRQVDFRLRFGEDPEEEDFDVTTCPHCLAEIDIHNPGDGCPDCGEEIL